MIIAAEVLTAARALYAQAHTITKTLNAAQPPFTDVAATRTLLAQWEEAQGLDPAGEAARIAATLTQRDEYGYRWQDYTDGQADDVQLAALQKAVGCLRTQGKALHEAVRAFNERFGGYPYLLQQVGTDPTDAAAQELLAGRPDVKKLWRRLYGKQGAA